VILRCVRAGRSPTLVDELSAGEKRLEARLADGALIAADNVVAAAGVANFANVPEEVVRSLDPARYSHTCALTSFEHLRARRVLIVGGRQSAYEWAALIGERAHAEIHVVHDHETPAFKRSDWSFVDGMIERTLACRGRFRNLPPEERDAISKRFWSEGRLKLEPWLADRVKRQNITDWALTHVVEYRQEATGEIVAVLSDDQRIAVDHVVLATGYRVTVAGVPYLARSHLAADLHAVDGCPVLDEDFQSSVPSLFFTGFVAARDFGPFLGFVRGCPAAARIIVTKVKARLATLAHAEQAGAHAARIVESPRSRPSPHHDRPGPGAARAG
jgi:thioredoxin reductase